MARVTVEDCIRYFPNRFEMVLLASRRARQLQDGLPALMDVEGDKPTVNALREMGEGFISWEVLYDQESQQRRKQADMNEALEGGEA
ncbi:MAG: DNA-directed RNA polymerase subunit omega [Mariprofundus sp.]|nr:DNA-directed RNA polymerase subunit omega [Mariprofundus sp.]